MQLVAYGAQDVYLTGNPQITFFKVVYRRHTNFSVEMDELPVDVAKPSGTFTVQVLRNGDLATRMYLRLQTPALTVEQVNPTSNHVTNGTIAWVRRLGHACVKYFKVQIGGTDIDKHVGVWLDLWYELTHSVSQERGYAKMIGDVPEMTTLVGAPVGAASSVVLVPSYTLYVPLQFWFNRNPGLALPLIALQYHDVRLYVEMEDMNKLICWSGSAPNLNSLNQYKSAGIMVDYVYLDSEERRRFAQVGHEYLIEQVQFPGEDSINSGFSSTITNKTKMNFNHPCKELVWCNRCGAFNGAQASTNGRTKFLCYTNDDSAWNNAVDYAAANLATGTIVLPLNGTSGIAVNPLPTGVVLPTVGVFIPDPMTDGTSITVQRTATTPSGKLVTYVLTFANNSGSTVTAVNNGLVAFQASPLVLGSYNLLDTLAVDTAVAPNAMVSALVNITTGPNYALSNVVVTGHQLTLRDCSVPVADFTDSRVTTSGGANPWDVSVVQLNNYGLRLDGAGNPVQSGNIQLNGQDRFDICLGSYFNYVQPAQHHTRTPADGVNVYSFGLHPEQHQPSGTCNMSRIDTAILNLVLSDPFRSNQACPALNFVQDSKFYVFATNYNVLRIMSGMGGLAYSN